MFVNYTNQGIYSLKSKGPQMDPDGTPQDNGPEYPEQHSIPDHVNGF